MRQTIVSVLAATALLSSTPAFAQATTKENVDKLRQRDVVSQLRKECQSDNERACQVIFLLKYIGQQELQTAGTIERIEANQSWEAEKAEEYWCQYLRTKVDLLEAEFQIAVLDGKRADAERSIRSAISWEDRVAQDCSE